MYEFNKLENEEILLISDNTTLKKENKDINITTILTNERLILLDYPSNINSYEDALRFSQNQSFIKKKEIIFETKINEIDEIIEETYDKYVLKNSAFFYLKDVDLKKRVRMVI